MRRTECPAASSSAVFKRIRRHTRARSSLLQARRRPGARRAVTARSSPSARASPRARAALPRRRDRRPRAAPRPRRAAWPARCAACRPTCARTGRPARCFWGTGRRLYWPQRGPAPAPPRSAMRACGLHARTAPFRQPRHLSQAYHMTQERGAVPKAPACRRPWLFVRHETCHAYMHEWPGCKPGPRSLTGGSASTRQRVRNARATTHGQWVRLAECRRARRQCARGRGCTQEATRRRGTGPCPAWPATHLCQRVCGGMTGAHSWCRRAAAGARPRRPRPPPGAPG